MKKILLTALSCSVFALGACGGGGGGVASTPAPTPPPTPAPAPTYTKLADLQGSQTFQTATLAYSQPQGGPQENFDVQQFGSGLVFDYDLNTDTVILTSKSGATVTLTQADLDPNNPSSTTTLNFRKNSPNGNVTNIVSLFLGGGQSGREYSATASWVRASNVGGPAEYEQAVGGIPTIPSDMPTNVTASYSGGFGGGARDATGKAFGVSPADSTLGFSANFGAGTIDISMAISGRELPTNPNSPLQSIANLTGTANITAGSNGFLGNLTGTLFNVNANGELVGAFFGPQAQEALFSYYAASPTGETVVGIGSGIKN